MYGGAGCKHMLGGAESDRSGALQGCMLASWPADLDVVIYSLQLLNIWSRALRSHSLCLLWLWWRAGGLKAATIKQGARLNALSCGGVESCVLPREVAGAVPEFTYSIAHNSLCCLTRWPR